VPSFRIPYLSVARIHGEDAGAFLQSQLSADVLALEPGDNTFACYCTPKGQVLGLLLIERLDNGFLAAARAELMPGIARRLGMYVLRSKVQIEMEPSLSVIGEQGVEYAFSERADEMPDPEAWRASELHAGIAWLESGTAERFIPQMLGFDQIGAVSFSKGCYPGQEIVARARYLGKVKRKPLIVEIDGTPDIENGEKVRLRRNSEWTDAVVVDHARDGGQTTLFTVARAEEGSMADEAEIDGQVYRCATT
jgi:folate-binding protein YgfZ